MYDDIERYKDLDRRSIPPQCSQLLHTTPPQTRLSAHHWPVQALATFDSRISEVQVPIRPGFCILLCIRKVLFSPPHPAYSKKNL